MVTFLQIRCENSTNKVSWRVYSSSGLVMKYFILCVNDESFPYYKKWIRNPCTAVFSEIRAFCSGTFFQSCRIFSPPGKNLHKDMLYTTGKIRVSGFRKWTGSILQSWAKQFKDQNINALKIAKNSKTNEIFVVII